MEIIPFLTFYIYTFIIGLIGLPFSKYIFKESKDLGYGFSKIIGLIIIAFPLWFLSSIHLIQFNDITVLAALIIGLIISIILLTKSKYRINKYIIFEEIIFFLVLLIWGIIRSTNPELLGTEKPMEVAFLNSIDKTTYFPPLDPWFSGETINYYYMGHYFYGFIGKLTSIRTELLYNLSLNFIVAQSIISIASIMGLLFTKVRFYKYVLISTFSSLLILIAGNIHYFYRITMKFLGFHSAEYFFPNSSRIIDYTINEFPSYSIIVGDLHGHYNAIPFFLLCIGFSLVYSKIPHFTKRKLIFSLIFSVPIVLSYSINSWDFITLNLIFLFLNIFTLIFGKYKIPEIKILQNVKFLPNKVKKIISGSIHIIFLQVVLNSIGVILLLPYILNFSPAVSGIGFVPWEIKSNPLHWFLYWGGFIIIGIFFGMLITIFKPQKKFNNIIWIFTLLFVASGLIIGVEFFHMKDLFFEVNKDYFRTNTVFKFYYHSWFLMGIISSYLTFHIFDNFNKDSIVRLNFLKRILSRKVTKIFVITIIQTGVIAVFLVCLAYIQNAVSSWFKFDNYEEATLNGIYTISKSYPEDYEMINWMNQNLPDQNILIEAHGDAYTIHNRISTYAGQVNIIGWPTHEWQWRGNIDEINLRKADIDKFYSSRELDEIKNLIEKYNVKYIYFGQLEDNKYPVNNIDIYYENYTVLYRAGNSILFELQ